jgi:pyruvate/2-oxoglutarate/acetoin dehydrogenase E1 component
MREILYAEALVEALRHQMKTDERVHLLGQYFLGLTPHRALMADLRDDYPDRVYYPPIAEVGYVGTGIGAAMAGLRPIVDIATASFMFQAWPQIVNEAANIHYMSGGQTAVPMVFHFNHGIRGGGAAQHSHSPQAMLWNTPGLEIMAPSTPRDVKGLVKTAVATDNPTAWVDHVRLFDVSGPVPDEDDFAIPFGVADIKRVGSDVTIVATSWMVQLALQATEELADRGIDVELVDPRTLVPLDETAILDSVAKTGRLVVVDECHRRCGVASEIVALVCEQLQGEMHVPPIRITAEDVPIPFSPPLEERVRPTVERIVDAIVMAS